MQYDKWPQQEILQKSITSIFDKCTNEYEWKFLISATKIDGSLWLSLSSNERQWMCARCDIGESVCIRSCSFIECKCSIKPEYLRTTAFFFITCHNDSCFIGKPHIQDSVNKIQNEL